MHAHPQPPPPPDPQAFILLCDLLLILSHQGPEEHTGLGLLFFIPNHVLQGKLIAFVREHVFLEEAGPPGQFPGARLEVGWASGGALCGCGVPVPSGSCISQESLVHTTTGGSGAP